VLGLCALAAAGCASTQSALTDVPELTEVPFFPQFDYDCGPAALATILNAAAIDVTPGELVDQVYIAGLQGSLQPELLGATRRHGLLPVMIDGGVSGVLAALASGRPVLVLQNLGFERLPAWHYAVVVGVDATRQRVILRSGAEARRSETARRFVRSWSLGEEWGFVAVHPEEVPNGVTPEAYLRAVIGSQRQLGEARVDEAYRSALAHWPDDPLVLFMSASHQHAARRLEYAARLYRQLLAQNPAHAVARNNLANVLLEQGCRAQALREARTALSQESPNSEFYSALSNTVREIEAAAPRAPQGTACTTG